MFIVLFTVQDTCGSEAEGALRLTQRSTHETIGRLEVCFGGYWGSVCGIGATDTIADIACRQLNYATEGTMCNYIILWKKLMFIFVGEVYWESNITYSGRYPIVPTVWTNMVCTDDDETLLDCFRIEYGNAAFQGCDHSYDIFISCACKCGRYGSWTWILFLYIIFML